MTDDLDCLSQIANKCKHDVLQANAMLKSARIATDNRTIKAGLEDRFAACGYNRIIRALWESGAVAILRVFDRGSNRTLSLPRFLKICEKEDVLHLLQKRISSWPMVDRGEEHAILHESLGVMREVSQVYQMKYEAKMKFLRNKALAHNEKPASLADLRYGELAASVELAERAVSEMLRTSEGIKNGLGDHLSIDERGAIAFWNVFAVGLSSSKEQETDPGPISATSIFPYHE